MRFCLGLSASALALIFLCAGVVDASRNMPEDMHVIGFMTALLAVIGVVNI